MLKLLNSLNFRPASREKGKYSIVFMTNGKFRERRFETKEEADNFAKPWIEEYSKDKWKHNPIEDWVCIQEDPLFLRIKSNGDMEEL